MIDYKTLQEIANNAYPYTNQDDEAQAFFHFSDKDIWREGFLYCYQLLYNQLSKNVKEDGFKMQDIIIT